MATLFSLHNPDETLLPFAGGKAANLAHLPGKLPVAEGIAVTSRFVAAWSQAEPQLAEATLAYELTCSDEAAEALSGLLLTLKLPSTLKTELEDALQVIRDFAGSPFIVRSSAVGEDGSELSFAGIHESIHDCRGLDEIIHGLRQCLASMASQRAAAYRRQWGLQGQPVGFAALIQVQIATEIAGVFFTRNPQDLTMNHQVIEAVPGQGEALVSGAVTPEYLVLDEASGEAVEHRPFAADTSPLIDDSKRDGLRRMADAVEATLGEGPWDIEWGATGRTLWLFQARPITTGRSGRAASSELPWAEVPPLVATGLAGHRLALCLEIIARGIKGGGLEGIALNEGGEWTWNGAAYEPPAFRLTPYPPSVAVSWQSHESNLRRSSGDRFRLWQSRNWSLATEQKTVLQAGVSLHRRIAEMAEASTEETARESLEAVLEWTHGYLAKTAKGVFVQAPIAIGAFLNLHRRWLPEVELPAGALLPREVPDGEYLETLCEAANTEDRSDKAAHICERWPWMALSGDPGDGVLLHDREAMQMLLSILGSSEAPMSFYASYGQWLKEASAKPEELASAIGGILGPFRRKVYANAARNARTAVEMLLQARWFTAEALGTVALCLRQWLKLSEIDLESGDYDVAVTDIFSSGLDGLMSTLERKTLPPRSSAQPLRGAPGHDLATGFSWWPGEHAGHLVCLDAGSFEDSLMRLAKIGNPRERTLSTRHVPWALAPLAWSLGGIVSEDPCPVSFPALTAPYFRCPLVLGVKLPHGETGTVHINGETGEVCHYPLAKGARV